VPSPHLAVGRGEIRAARDARILFLPQRPYLPIGVLRDVVSYPMPAQGVDDGTLREALEVVGLTELAARLDEAAHWAQRLSPGEQQRIAFARALVQKPEWLFLDEATSAVDEATEARLYRLMRERLAETTVFSIGHRRRYTPSTRAGSWCSSPATTPAPSWNYRPPATWQRSAARSCATRARRTLVVVTGI